MLLHRLLLVRVATRKGCYTGDENALKLGHSLLLGRAIGGAASSDLGLGL